jgi:hypothetical protein
VAFGEVLTEGPVEELKDAAGLQEYDAAFPVAVKAALLPLHMVALLTLTERATGVADTALVWEAMQPVVVLVTATVKTPDPVTIGLEMPFVFRVPVVGAVQLKATLVGDAMVDN